MNVGMMEFHYYNENRCCQPKLGGRARGCEGVGMRSDWNDGGCTVMGEGENLSIYIEANFVLFVDYLSIPGISFSKFQLHIVRSEPVVTLYRFW